MPWPHCLRNLSPYGMPGDRLWVKEAIRHVGGGCSEYIADRTPTVADAWPWKRDQLPGMFCPRGLSRITIEVTDVRVQRLQDISEEDARAEGAISAITELDGRAHDNAEEQWCRWSKRIDKTARVATARGAFASLWFAINGKRGGCSWDDNPWVWPVTFAKQDEAAP
jgi:hypothetical protein